MPRRIRRCSITKPCLLLPTTDAKVVVDPDGDLHLRVGTTECISSDDGHGRRRATVFVCESKTLSRASTVWKSMLYGPWRESRDSNNPSQAEWVVELPDDKVEPMTTILNIIHSRFESLESVQARDSIPKLYELTVLSDKYDLAKVIRPWAKSWLQPLRDQYAPGWTPIRKTDYPWVLHKQLWIAWELGDLFLLDKTLQEMVFNLKDWEFDGPQPPGLLEKAQAASDQAVADIYDVFQHAVDDFVPRSSRGIPPKDIRNKCFDQETHCHFVMLGSLMTSLVEKGLWPLPEKGSRQHSLRDLLTVASTMKLQNKEGILEDPRPISLFSSCKSDTKASAFKATSQNGTRSPFGRFPKGLSVSVHSNHGVQVPSLGSAQKSLHDEHTDEVQFDPDGIYGHVRCHPVPKARKTIEQSCSGVFVELEHSHLKHLQSQAAKTGI